MTSSIQISIRMGASSKKTDSSNKKLKMEDLTKFICPTHGNVGTFEDTKVAYSNGLYLCMKEKGPDNSLCFQACAKEVTSGDSS